MPKPIIPPGQLPGGPPGQRPDEILPIEPPVEPPATGDVSVELSMAKATAYQGELAATTGGGTAELTTNSTNPTGVTITTYAPADNERVWLTAPLRSASGTYFTKWQCNGVDYDTASTTSLIPGTDTMTAVYTTPATTGVPVSPGTDTLLAAVAANADGSTLLLLAGNHVLTEPVLPKTGMTLQGENGAIVKGVGATGGFIGFSNFNVTLRNLIIEDFNGSAAAVGGAGSAIKAVDGWLIENCEMRDIGEVGVVAYGSAIVRNNWVHTNGIYGLVGSPALWEGNIVENNNTLHNDPWVDAGASKFIHSTNMVMRGNIFQDNYGIGIWPDYNNSGALYENNILRNNLLAGLFNEVNCNTVIRHNVLDSNSAGIDGSLWNGGQIASRGSSDVEIYENDITVGTGKNGVAIRWDSGTYTTAQCGVMGVTNVSVHHNVIRLAAGALTGYVGEPTSVDFSDNVYVLPDPDGEYFLYSTENGSLAMTFAEWQALGHDV